MSELHSFGGHTLDRYVFDYMPDDGADAAGLVTDAGGEAAPSPAAAPPTDGAAGEPTPPDGATAAAEPPAAPALDPLEVQAELEYLRGQNQQFTEAFQQLLAQGATPADAHQAAANVTGFDPAQLNPLDENFGPALVGLLAQERQQTLAAMQEMVQQIQAPFAAQQEQAQLAEGEQRLTDILADDIARNGEFASDPQADQQARQLVRTLADQMFPQIAERYGATPRSAEIAMSQAAAQVRGLLAAVAGQAQTQQANQLATLAGLHGEPGAGAVGAVVPAQASVNGESLATKYARTAA